MGVEVLSTGGTYTLIGGMLVCSPNLPVVKYKDIHSYPPDAPVIRASLPRISLSIGIFGLSCT
jgi:hypothetical protein